VAAAISAVLTAALTMGLLVFVSAPAATANPADRKRKVDASIEELRHDLEGTSKELTDAAVQLKQTEERLPDAEAELQQAQATLADARAKDAELASRLAAASESEAKATAALENGEQEITQINRQLGRIANAAYRGGSMTPGLAIALSADSPADFATRYVMVDTALRSQNGALARLREQQALREHQEARLQAVREEIARLKAEAEANLERARQAEADAAARKAEIEQLRDQLQKALAVIEARKADETKRLDQLTKERAALEAELRRIEQERRKREAEEARKRAAADKAARARGQKPPARSSQRPPSSSGGSTLSYPVNGYITSHYGYRIHPIYKIRRLHGGTDFGAACGTPVRAAASGTVVRAGWNGGFGNQIVVHHGTLRGQGVATSYNHLSRYAVHGGSVSRGQVIGYVGTTGSSTGCHLHFEVYVNGGTTNPMGWL
jgi:murein DD-endopeptidase MepM/ murein hydrolase activator NlpD